MNPQPINPAPDDQPPERVLIEDYRAPQNGIAPNPSDTHLVSGHKTRPEADLVAPNQHYFADGASQLASSFGIMAGGYLLFATIRYIVNPDTVGHIMVTGQQVVVPILIASIGLLLAALSIYLYHGASNPPWRLRNSWIALISVSLSLVVYFVGSLLVWLLTSHPAKPPVSRETETPQSLSRLPLLPAFSAILTILWWKTPCASG
jgi:hypothetical protein